VQPDQNESATKKSKTASSSSAKKLVVKPVFVVPKRISLQADPARCTEVLDDLYKNYYELEVRTLVQSL
jgi:hypothetical protein